MQDVYIPSKVSQQQETENEIMKDVQRQQNSQAYMDQLKKVQHDRNQNYSQTLQMQIQQHELQK